MTNSKNIAGLVGPILIALAITEAMNLHIWAINIPPVTYLSGTFWFVIGLAIVRAHNRWLLGWPALITLVGWVFIIGGLFRMFAPEAPENAFTYTGLMVIFSIGSYLTFKAYKREDSGTAVG